MLNIKGYNCGCYSNRICCKGRNITCKAKDDGFNNIQFNKPPVKLIKFHNDEFPPVLSQNGDKIGRLILPDFVEIDDNKFNFSEIQGHAEFLSIVDGEEYRKKFTPPPPRPTTKTRRTITEIIFGSKFDGIETPETITYEKGKPVIRLSTLNRYLPVKIGKTITPEETITYDDDEYVYSSDERLMYLTESHPECFCDEYCIQFGDCCSDYTYYCLPRDCQVSQWSQWSSCLADNRICGYGRQERRRTIIMNPVHAGLKCPPLIEARACDKPCPSSGLKDITTVALLLPYEYHKSRENYKHPRSLIPNHNHTNYCVTYKLGWVNRNCVEKRFKQSFIRGRTICAECQPEAQYHRNTPRCASDLEDGQKGYWKLIGPPSCYGIWYRITSYNNCYCNSYPKLKDLDPYLMV